MSHRLPPKVVKSDLLPVNYSIAVGLTTDPVPPTTMSGAITIKNSQLLYSMHASRSLSKSKFQSVGIPMYGFVMVCIGYCVEYTWLGASSKSDPSNATSYWYKNSRIDGCKPGFFPKTLGAPGFEVIISSAVHNYSITGSWLNLFFPRKIF